MVYSPEYSPGNTESRIQTDTAVGLRGLKPNCKNGSGGTPVNIRIHHHGGEVHTRSRAHEYSIRVNTTALLEENIYVLKQLDAMRSRDVREVGSRVNR
ncbi:hypothetical protein F4801DRAFT_557995 [Xylaria longipes]|nr:hypothetical protein F4801DRAFT_557995 [Xylaria longipes]